MTQTTTKINTMKAEWMPDINKMIYNGVILTNITRQSHDNGHIC